jgi:hypothetical protein
MDSEFESTGWPNCLLGDSEPMRDVTQPRLQEYLRSRGSTSDGGQRVREVADEVSAVNQHENLGRLAEQRGWG